MKKMLTYAFIFWLGIIPFVVWNGYFEGPKVFVFLIGGFLLSIFWLIKIFKNPSSLKLERKDAWYWIWLLILTISSLFGVHPLVSILGGSYRYQGVIFFLTLWLIGKTVGLLTRDKKKLLHRCIGLSVIGESVIILYQIIFGKLYFGLPLATLGEANAVAGFLAIGTLFIFESLPKILLTLPIFALLFTGSRSGLLSTLPIGGLAASGLPKKIKKIFLPILVIFTLLIFCYFSFGKGGSFFENRPTIWRLAITQILKKPVLGFGAESGEAVFNTAFYTSGFPLYDLSVDRSHNLILDVAMWSGLMGLTFFSFWLYYNFLGLKSIGRKMAYLGFLIFSMLQPLGVTHWILFILIISPDDRHSSII